MKVSDLLESRFIRHFDYSLDLRQPFALFDDFYSDTRQSNFDRHYELEVGVVLSGRMRRIYKTHEVTLEPGEAWLCGMWEPHGFVIDEAPCEVFGFVILPEYLSQHREEGVDLRAPFYTRPEQRPLRVADSAQHGQAELLGMVNRLRRKLAEGNQTLYVWTKVLIVEILLGLYDALPAPPRSSKRRPLRHEEALQSAIRLVLETKGTVSVSSAADVAGMSESTFSRAFSAYTGSTFQRFALRQRVNGALQTILTTNLPVKSVAYEWGFHDASHFYKAFHRFFDASPMEYKEQYLNRHALTTRKIE